MRRLGSDSHKQAHCRAVGQRHLKYSKDYKENKFLDEIMTEKIGEFTEAHLLNVAKDLVEKKTKDSKVLDAEYEARIPKFDLDGEYCMVAESIFGGGTYVSNKYQFRTFDR